MDGMVIWKIEKQRQKFHFFHFNEKRKIFKKIFYS